jgi:hypothetical protein
MHNPEEFDIAGYILRKLKEDPVAELKSQLEKKGTKLTEDDIIKIRESTRKALKIIEKKRCK